MCYYIGQTTKVEKVDFLTNMAQYDWNANTVSVSAKF